MSRVTQKVSIADCTTAAITKNIIYFEKFSNCKIPCKRRVCDRAPTSARGVLINCASSRRVRPRLRNHRMDIANRPHTYRLRWCGEEERGGVSDLYAGGALNGRLGAPHPRRPIFSRFGRAGARCHPAGGRTRPSRAPTSATKRKIVS